MRRLVRSRSFDVITCPAVHRGAGRLPPFATVVRVARIGVSIFSLEQKKKNVFLLCLLWSYGHPGFFFLCDAGRSSRQDRAGRR